MQTRKIESVGVVGSGTMGSGIAQVFAQEGFRVSMTDIRQDMIDRGLEVIRKSTDKLLQKGKLTREGRDATLGNISVSVGHGRLRDCDLVIEAVFEDMQGRRRSSQSWIGSADPKRFLPATRPPSRSRDLPLRQPGRIVSSACTS